MRLSVPSMATVGISDSLMVGALLEMLSAWQLELGSLLVRTTGELDGDTAGALVGALMAPLLQCGRRIRSYHVGMLDAFTDGDGSLSRLVS